jgi:hypothetical protein
MSRPRACFTERRFAGFVAAGFVLAVAVPVYAQAPVTPPGSGTAGDPYLISELGHLVWMGNTAASSSGKYYSLTADIDASPTAGWNDAGTSTDVLEGFKPIGTWAFPDTTSFRGVFEGNGHTIGSLVVHRPATSGVGLFGYLGSAGQVRNLGMIAGAVTGRGYVGGLVGYNYGTVSNCYTTGVVMAAQDYIGGLVGSNWWGTISNCYATGTVTGAGSYAGGLVGYNWGAISNCYTTGAVTGLRDYVGGLLGYSDSAAVSNCYATGAVTATGTFVGGLVGCTSYHTVSSYWDTQTSGRIISDGGIGKTTAQLKQQATFAGWDFTGVWGIVEGTSYPCLRFSPPPFKLTVSISGPGSVTVDPPSGDGTYAPGTVVTLTAVPAGSTAGLVRWMGAAPNGSPAVTVVMDMHRSVTAVFGPRIEITSLTDLTKIGTDPGYPLVDALYVLAADIDASATATWNDTGTTADLLEGFKPIGTYSLPDTTSFRGVFDGNSHTISGLAVNRPATDYVGLFGCVGVGGQVRNLGLVGGAVTGKSKVGGLVGWSSDMVLNCSETGAVTGKDYVGALVGYNQYGTVSKCHAAGPVTGAASYAYTGGLLGYNYDGTVSDCYATGAVTGLSNKGGLLGYNYYGTVSDCYATGAVTGSGTNGGLLGYNYYGTVSNCYATGAVTGWSALGGLLGYNSGTVSNSYWDMQTSGRGTSSGGTGKTTTQMKQQATFAGWDFAGLWDIVEGTSYPYLRFSPPPFKLAVNISGPGGVIVDPPSGDGTYAPGTLVTLTAVPGGPRDVLIRWAGAAPSESPTVTLVMDTHRSVTAVFGPRIEINSLADLAKIGNDPGYPLVDVLYILTADIDASATAGWNDAGTATDVLEGFKPIGTDSTSDTTSFRGIFDGNGHTISGLVVNRPATSNVGLFGGVGAGGFVRNLGLVGGAVTGKNWVGGLVGGNSGTVSNCYATGAVMGYSYVGGLIGYTYYGTVSKCYATGAVTGAENGVGGLVGNNSYSTVSNCYAIGAVAATATGSYAGGLVGYNYSSTVSNCYATGAVTGKTYVGGLVGSNALGTVSKSYWDTQTSGQGTSSGGTGKATVQMKQQATFAGWDFTGIWGIVEGTSYPYLRVSPPSFKLTVNISGPGSVTVDPPSADGTYAPGTIVSLTAVPNESTAEFNRWVGATPGGSLTVTVVMDIHRSVTPVFWPRIEINSLASLAKIGNDPGYPLADVVYVLTTDIDASATAAWNDAGTGTDVLEGFKPIGRYPVPPDTVSFRGIFDGNGHTISGLVINRPANSYVGLFGYAGSTGQVRNLGMVGGAVTGVSDVGGLVGDNYGTVSNSYATGAVTGYSDVGGLVGNNPGTVSNSYATGAVTCTGNNVGGLVGSMYSGMVSKCYATGAVTGTGGTVGGLVGVNSGGTVSNSYWDMQTSGQGTSPGGTGKTTAEMKQRATFVGWDFTNIWGITENVTYPFLRSWVSPDFDHDRDVDLADFLEFEGCFNGPNRPSAQPNCDDADLDADADVDLADFLIFQGCFNGPNRPPQCP